MINIYFKDKKKIKYKKLKINILKNTTLSIISKNIKNYYKKLFIEYLSKLLVNKKKLNAT